MKGWRELKKVAAGVSVGTIGGGWEDLKRLSWVKRECRGSGILVIGISLGTMRGGEVDFLTCGFCVLVSFSSSLNAW